jgi:hypothetical protein
MNRFSRVVWLLVGLGVTTTLNCLVLAEEVGDGPVPAENEVVMSPGTKITATTKVGTITITAGKGLKRLYTWEGATRSVEMWPREERWYGSLGLYFPGPGEHWANHKGITRGVVEEGQQHFDTTEEAQKWLAGRVYMPCVYHDDGLVVGWSKTPARRQLNVEVWQIRIKGKKPTKLPGSQSDKIKVEQPERKQKSKAEESAAPDRPRQ